MDKVFYYSIIKNISIIKSSSDLDNKELFPVSSSISLKLWSSLYNWIKEEYIIDTDYPEIIDSGILVILSSSVCNKWQKRQIHIKTDFEVTGWMLCVIPNILEDAKYHSDSNHSKQVMGYLKKNSCYSRYILDWIHWL